jgi:hypothetical protein
VAGAILMQLRPCAEDRALKLYEPFERGVHRAAQVA